MIGLLSLRRKNKVFAFLTTEPSDIFFYKMGKYRLILLIFPPALPWHDR